MFPVLFTSMRQLAFQRIRHRFLIPAILAFVLSLSLIIVHEGMIFSNLTELVDPHVFLWTQSFYFSRVVAAIVCAVYFSGFATLLAEALGRAHRRSRFAAAGGLSGFALYMAICELRMPFTTLSMYELAFALLLSLVPASIGMLSSGRKVERRTAQVLGRFILWGTLIPVSFLIYQGVFELLRAMAPSGPSAVYIVVMACLIFILRDLLQMLILPVSLFAILPEQNTSLDRREWLRWLCAWIVLPAVPCVLLVFYAVYPLVHYFGLDYLANLLKFVIGPAAVFLTLYHILKRKKDRLSRLLAHPAGKVVLVVGALLLAFIFPLLYDAGIGYYQMDYLIKLHTYTLLAFSVLRLVLTGEESPMSRSFMRHSAKVMLMLLLLQAFLFLSACMHHYADQEIRRCAVMTLPCVLPVIDSLKQRRLKPSWFWYILSACVLVMILFV